MVNISQKAAPLLSNGLMNWLLIVFSFVGVEAEILRIKALSSKRVLSDLNKSQSLCEPNVVAHAYNPSTRKLEAGDQVSGPALAIE